MPDTQQNLGLPVPVTAPEVADGVGTESEGCETCNGAGHVISRTPWESGICPDCEGKG